MRTVAQLLSMVIVVAACASSKTAGRSGTPTATVAGAADARSQALCQEAVVRRQSAERVFVTRPPSSNDPSEQRSWEASRDEARRQIIRADTAIRIYCRELPVTPSAPLAVPGVPLPVPASGR